MRGELGAGRDSELGEDVTEVHLDGAASDEHALGDLRVGEPGGDQADDTQLGGGEAVPARGRTLAFAACPRDVLDHLAERKARGLDPSAARTSPRRARPRRRVDAWLTRRFVDGSRGQADLRSQRVGGREAAHRFARALGVERERAERVERRRRFPASGRGATWRPSAECSRSSAAAGSPLPVSDERELVLDQSRAANRCRTASRAPRPRRARPARRRGRRRFASRRRARGEADATQIGGPVVRVPPRSPARRARARRGGVAGGERDVGEARDRLGDRRARSPPRSARARSASSPAAAPSRSPVAACASSDHASVKPPVDGSPTTPAALRPTGRTPPGRSRSRRGAPRSSRPPSSTRRGRSRSRAPRRRAGTHRARRAPPASSCVM